MTSLVSDVISVIAEFLPADTAHQQSLMLINQTWLDGVVLQHRMKTTPKIRWPMHVLMLRRYPKKLTLDRRQPCDADLEKFFSFSTCKTTDDIAVAKPERITLPNLEHFSAEAVTTFLERLKREVYCGGDAEGLTDFRVRHYGAIELKLKPLRALTQGLGAHFADTLQCVYLEGCKPLSYDGELQFLGSLNRLTTLSINCTELPDDDLAQLLDQVSGTLEQLKLRRSTNNGETAKNGIGEARLGAALRSLPHLKGYMDSNVSDEMIEALGERSAPHTLQKIEFRDSTRFSGAALKRFLFKSGMSLRMLSVPGCRNLKEEDLCEIIRVGAANALAAAAAAANHDGMEPNPPTHQFSLGALEKLNLGRCYVTDQILSIIVAHQEVFSKCLKHLNLAKSQITTAPSGYGNLSKLGYLKTLDISDMKVHQVVGGVPLRECRELPNLLPKTNVKFF